VCAGVREKYAVAIPKEPLAVAVHAEPIVADAVKQDDRVAVSGSRPQKPTAQKRSVGGADAYVLQIRIKRLQIRFDLFLLVLRYWATTGMDRHLAESDAAENGPGYIKHRENDAYASKQWMSFSLNSHNYSTRDVRNII